METVEAPSEINSLPSNNQTQHSADPISLAKDIGQTALDYIGAKVFEQLEITFISSLLKPLPEYPTFRLRQHPFIYGPQGTLKDVMVETFFGKCVPKTFRIKDLTSCTVEAAFGSISDDGKKLYLPAFWNYDMTLITELSGFLDKYQLKRQIGNINKIAEGNVVSRDLIKFSNASQELIDQYKDGKNGVVFDGRTLRYEPRITLVICSHFLDSETIKILNDNAFLDRFRLVQYDITDKQAEALLKSPLKKFDEQKWRSC